jgi:hypothetical protein
MPTTKYSTMATPVKRNAAGHALAIEHQEERQIDQSRTRLALADDEQHRQEDDGRGGEEMLPAMHVEAVGAHQFGNARAVANLRELGRLQTQRAQAPATSASL